MTLPPRESFFPPVEPAVPPEEVDDPGDEGSPDPDWQGPPTHLHAGLWAGSALLGRSTTTAVLVEGARAYASGAVLRMAIVTRRSARHLRRRMMSELDVTHGRGTLNLALPPGGLRWGFEYADGRRVTTLDPSPWTEIPEDTDPQTWEPRRPVMQPLNAPWVYGPTWRRDVWLWPLPPAGDLHAVCAWPDEGIEETRTTLDATALRAAARDARPLWPGTPVDVGHADRPAPEETEA